ncbi:hypothetical protein K458DRAFT_383116 [Lentithecium fluviatile CBS 122367]|uniref:Uncharacterized protein n=1 Tax=Lentithecium fluviatile CBS 122367 TaxID=1168545 RepID=A0A6G1JHF8_9PLEO|nr:hypothetical protein K458DRAFT_383116 [Lentithecium fluviatile CBS 122367]
MTSASSRTFNLRIGRPRKEKTVGSEIDEDYSVPSNVRQIGDSHQWYDGPVYLFFASSLQIKEDNASLACIQLHHLNFATAQTPSPLLSEHENLRGGLPHAIHHAIASPNNLMEGTPASVGETQQGMYHLLTRSHVLTTDYPTLALHVLITLFQQSCVSPARHMPHHTPFHVQRADCP